MTHSLTIRLGDRADLDWAQRTVESDHYLHQRVDPRARPMAYVIDYDAVPVGLVMLGIPHATRCGGWWGYPGLPTQWQVVDLCRIWLAPAIQHDNYWCRPDVVPGFYDRRGVFRPTTPTWAISEVLRCNAATAASTKPIMWWKSSAAECGLCLTMRSGRPCP